MIVSIPEYITSHSTNNSMDSYIQQSSPPMCQIVNDEINVIESSSEQSCSNNDHHQSMELTPYPYTQTSQEINDYYQLEQSMGEDWSFQLACELSSCDMSDVNDDTDSICDMSSLCDDNEIVDVIQREYFFESVELKFDIHS